MTGVLAGMLVAGFMLGYAVCYWLMLYDEHEQESDLERERRFEPQRHFWSVPEPPRPFDYEEDDPHGTGSAT